RRLVAMVVAALAASGDEDDEMERRLSAGDGRKRRLKWGGGKVEARDAALCQTFDLTVHDFDWFFDEMKIVVELTFISQNG
nr:hypothetical protein [Tanacetum cinerariifolium]